MGFNDRLPAIDSLSPEELCLAASAFDEAVASLSQDWPDEAVELLASHVIELALKGERSPARLRDAALAQLRTSCGEPRMVLAATA